MDPARRERFTLFLRIPAWSEGTTVTVNGVPVEEVPSGGYLPLERKWAPGDRVEIVFDMKARLLDAPEGSNPAGKDFQAVQWGPIVLSRDENIDPAYDAPVQVVADEGGVVAVEPVTPQRPGTRLEFIVPTTDGPIRMVDYSSVDCWEGTHIQTWLPIKR